MTPEILSAIQVILLKEHNYQFNRYTDFPENFEFEYLGDSLPKHVIMFDLIQDFTDFDNIPYTLGIDKNIKLKDFEQARIELMMTSVIDQAISNLIK